MKGMLTIILLVCLVAALLPVLWIVLSGLMVILAALGALLVACPIIAIPIFVGGLILVLAIIGLVSLFTKKPGDSTGKKKE